MRVTTLELSKESMKFSAAHFTIFGPADRENLHGHNFTIGVDLDAEVDDETGMSADYRKCKQIINAPSTLRPTATKKSSKTHSASTST